MKKNREMERNANPNENRVEGGDYSWNIYEKKIKPGRKNI